jgi:glucose uptake protein GlcU
MSGVIFYRNWRETMWKIAVGFVAFAALALFIIMQAGDKVDMRGESGGHETAEHAAPAAK